MATDAATVSPGTDIDNIVSEPPMSILKTSVSEGSDNGEPQENGDVSQSNEAKKKHVRYNEAVEIQECDNSLKSKPQREFYTAPRRREEPYEDDWRQANGRGGNASRGRGFRGRGSFNNYRGGRDNVVFTPNWGQQAVRHNDNYQQHQNGAYQQNNRGNNFRNAPVKRRDDNNRGKRSRPLSAIFSSYNTPSNNSGSGIIHLDKQNNQRFVQEDQGGHISITFVNERRSSAADNSNNYAQSRGGRGNNFGANKRGWGGGVRRGNSGVEGGDWRGSFRGGNTRRGGGRSVSAERHNDGGDNEKFNGKNHNYRNNESFNNKSNFSGSQSNLDKSTENDRYDGFQVPENMRGKLSMGNHSSASGRILAPSGFRKQPMGWNNWQNKKTLDENGVRGRGRGGGNNFGRQSNRGRRRAYSDGQELTKAADVETAQNEEEPESRAKMETNRQKHDSQDDELDVKQFELKVDMESFTVDSPQTHHAILSEPLKPMLSDTFDSSDEAVKPSKEETNASKTVDNDHKSSEGAENKD